MGVGGQHQDPAALPPGTTQYLLYSRLGGPQGQSGWVRKISPAPGFDPLTVQPVASHYIDWAIPAPNYHGIHTEIWVFYSDRIFIHYLHLFFLLVLWLYYNLSMCILTLHILILYQPCFWRTVPWKWKYGIQRYKVRFCMFNFLNLNLFSYMIILCTYNNKD